MMTEGDFANNNNNNNNNNGTVHEDDPYYNNGNNEPPLDKEVLEQYGARCQAIRTAMTEHAKRVTRDPEEFRHLQARLRGQHQQTTTTTTPSVMMMGTTDAWLKQNLAVLVRVHARDCELRASARRQIRQSQEACLALPQQKQPQQPQTGSPTSVMQEANGLLDAVTMKQHVMNPPLAPSALFPVEEPAEGELLWR